jgi:hypothetical protein
MKASVEASEEKQAEIKKLLKQINAALLDHDRQGSRERGGHHWGYVGDLQHVAHELKMIHNFLTGNEDEDW